MRASTYHFDKPLKHSPDHESKKVKYVSQEARRVRDMLSMLHSCGLRVALVERDDFGEVNESR